MFKEFKNKFFSKKNLFEFDDQTLFIDGKRILLKKAREENLEDFMRIQNKIYIDRQPWGKFNFYSEIINKNNLYLIAQFGSQPIAFVGLSKKSPYRSHITNIGVVPDFQNGRLGHFLIKTCINISKELGFRTITLEVDNQNTPALSLYKSFDFYKVKTRYHYYDNGHDAFELSKDLVEN